MTRSPPRTPDTPLAAERERPYSVLLEAETSNLVWMPTGVHISDIPLIFPNRISSEELFSPQCKRLHREPSSPHRMDALCGIPVHLNETDIGLFRLHGTDGIFATQLTCPHMGARLTQGARFLVNDIEDVAIECPLHKMRFDLKSGKLLSRGSAENLKTYPSRIRNDGNLEIGFEAIAQLVGFSADI